MSSAKMTTTFGGRRVLGCCACSGRVAAIPPALCNSARLVSSTVLPRRTHARAQENGRRFQPRRHIDGDAKPNRSSRALSHAEDLPGASNLDQSECVWL